MRVLITMIFCLAFSAAISQPKIALAIDHMALVVKDLEASADFYMEVMGFPEIENNPTGKSNIRWFLAPDGTEMHLIEKDAEIKLNKSVHMAFEVEDINAFMDHLRKHKVPFEDWPGNKDVSNERSDGVNQIYFRDPSGYWIEVNDAVDQ